MRTKKAQPASYSGMAHRWDLERALAGRILMKQQRKELQDRGDRAVATKPRRQRYSHQKEGKL